MISIDRLDASSIDTVAPLWRALQAHHAGCAPQLGAVRPFRDADSSWALRRTRYLEYLAGDRPAALLVARAGAHAVGYAMVRCVSGGPTLQTADVVGHLDSLVVAPDYRSAGIGGQLLGRVMAVQHEWQVREFTVNVIVGNSRAEQLYRDLGMTPFATSFIGRVR